MGNATSAVLVGDTSGNNNASLLTNGAITIARAITVQSGSTGIITLGGNSASASVMSGAIAINKNVVLSAIASGTVTFGTGVMSGGGSVTSSGAGTGF